MSRSLAEHKDVPEKLADLARIESLQPENLCAPAICGRVIPLSVDCVATE
ncbi:hypothetical protein [Nitrosomonas supralitoralis]|nr:hypothetical protein [Nitrosomonas supralitoralis]